MHISHIMVISRKLIYILFCKQNETGQKEIALEDFKVTDKYHAEKIVSDSLGIVDVL